MELDLVSSERLSSFEDGSWEAILLLVLVVDGTGIQDVLRPFFFLSVLLIELDRCKEEGRFRSTLILGDSLLLAKNSDNFSLLLPRRLILKERC